MRKIDEELLEDIVIGSTVLGSGGGGDPYIGKLLARQAIRAHGAIPSPDLDDVPDDARIIFVGALGAPGVLIEKTPRADEVISVLAALEKYLGYAFTHIAPIEAGGLNAVLPIAAAGVRGLPLVDADGMGRAFPGLDMVTPTLYGASATPMAVADEHGNTSVINSATNGWAEDIARAVAVASGCITLMALFPMSGADAKNWLIRKPLTRAARIGEIIRNAQSSHESAVDALIRKEKNVRLLLEGKVVEVERRTEGGWTMGEAVVEGVGSDKGKTLRLRFQNEYLVALRDDEIVATSPDMIMTMGLEGGEPIPAEEIRYGYRVAAIGLPCDERWRSEAGIDLAGPRRWGYDVDYLPVESVGQLGTA